MKMKSTIGAVVLGVLAFAAPGLAQQRGNGACGVDCPLATACGGSVAVPVASTKEPATARDRLTARLQEALASEYRARDFYRAADERFGLRRYRNVAAAEQHHVDALTALLIARGATPVTEIADQLAVAATIAATDAKAAAVERAQVAAYEALLAAVEAPQERAVLERIQSANFRHLQAATSGGGGHGRRAGNANRRGQTVDSCGPCALGCPSSRRC